MVRRQNSLLAGRTRLVCSDWLGVQGKDKKTKEKEKNEEGERSKHRLKERKDKYNDMLQWCINMWE